VHWGRLVATLTGCETSFYERETSDILRDVSFPGTVVEVGPRERFQGCMGVLEPAGVLAPGVVESAPILFFFFFFRGMRAGGLIRALRRDRYDPHVRQRLSGRLELQKTVAR
jgi:hypothetical protein